MVTSMVVMVCHGDPKTDERCYSNFTQSLPKLWLSLPTTRVWVREYLIVT